MFNLDLLTHNILDRTKCRFNTEPMTLVNGVNVDDLKGSTRSTFLYESIARSGRAILLKDLKTDPE